MFRGCYFEFAGKSSEPYNLMLFYKDNKRDDFNSGGEFELKTDSIPYSEEQFLYGKDYSENPLEFEVEIVTPEGNIPQMQMVEIKNWLFGQDGWRDLTVTDDTQAYHLKCVLIPSEDITDCNGYRGVRCTIHNASPFWYGNEREVVIDDFETQVYGYGNWYSIVNIEIPDNGCVNCAIYPTLIIDIDKRANTANDIKELKITATDAESINDAKEQSTPGIWSYPDTSGVSCDISYMGNKGNSASYDTITFNSKYAIFESTNYPYVQIVPTIDTSNPLSIIKLKCGSNFCRIKTGIIQSGSTSMYKSITVKYTPMYRMGAF